MPTEVKLIREEKSFLRWGGLAGILAGIFFLVTIITLVEFGPSTTATTAQLVAKFPSVRTGLAVGNAFYFLATISLVGLVLGLYHALRRTNPGLTLYGSVLFALGLGVEFVEDTTRVRLRTKYPTSIMLPGRQPRPHTDPLVAGHPGHVQSV